MRLRQIVLSICACVIGEKAKSGYVVRGTNQCRRGGSTDHQVTSSDVKQEVHDIAVFDDVVFAFNAQFAGCFTTCFTLVFDKVIV